MERYVHHAGLVGGAIPSSLSVQLTAADGHSVRRLGKRGADPG